MGLVNRSAYTQNMYVQPLENAVKVRASGRAILLRVYARMWDENVPLNVKPDPRAVDVWFPLSMIHEEYGGRMFCATARIIASKEEEIAKVHKKRMVEIVVGNQYAVRVPSMYGPSRLRR